MKTYRCRNPRKSPVWNLPSASKSRFLSGSFLNSLRRPSVAASVLGALLAVATQPAEAALYQDTVIKLSPTYYYQLNNTSTAGGAIDSMGRAVGPSSFNGDYVNGPAKVGGPGPLEVFGDILVPGVGGVANLAHYSNNSGHIILGPGAAYGANDMTVAFFMKAGPSQGGDRLFSNNLTDPTKSFQIDCGNNGLVMAVDPASTGVNAERTLYLEDNSAHDRRLIDPNSGWFHVVASTHGATGPERASNFKVWINGVNRTANLQPDATGWGVDTGLAKIGGRGADPTTPQTHSGAQDEMAIWLNRALTDAEVASLWAAALGAPIPPGTARLNGSLFKIDFGQSENERSPKDAEGNPLLKADGTEVGPPAALIDWVVIPTWTFADPNANVAPDSASITGVASADGTSVTWKLKDISSNPNDNVTLTIFDNKTLAEKLTPDAPAYMLGMTANNPTKEGREVVYDGVRVPFVVKDDYLYRAPDAAGSESLMRIANLDPGTYNVTVFEGRTSDSGRYGKIWVDDVKGAKEPAEANTGNYAGKNDAGEILLDGQPRTVAVKINAGDYLWFAEMEDNSGGISGMIIRSVIDPADSKGLFKIDFGQSENERVVKNDAGEDTEAPAPLADWNVIPTWTFDAPNANVVLGTASIEGTANAAATEVTWKLNDYSKDNNKNVTLTMLNNVALNDANQFPPALGQTVNNPTKEGIAVMYDGILVPSTVKDDYLYRNPDTSGSETLMRFGGLNAGKYKVTVFEGRTSDASRLGKIWVDDIKGLKEPAESNTGNYAGKNDAGDVLPLGQPRTVTLDIKAGEYIWFAEMEDNSGGVSGMIIRGLSGGSTPVTPGPLTVVKTASGASITYTGTLQTASGIKGPFTDVTGAASPYPVTTTGAAAFFRAR